MRIYKPNARALGVAAAAGLLLVLTACGGGDDGAKAADSKSAQEQTEQPRTDVPWEDYAAGVQGRIDRLQASKKCAALQKEFDAADRTNVATQNRAGHNNADLMGYIDEAMSLADCY